MLRLLAQKNMSRASSAASRTRTISRHMSTPSTADDTVLFSEENLALREIILNRPKKLNALNSEMIDLLSAKLQVWNNSKLAGTILLTGNGGALCAGGDVANVVKQTADESTRHLAIEFFQKEFEVDYLLSLVNHPYVAWMDGVTMGGGFGLAAHAPFRIATERTIFAMPETKIGYFPDVGVLHVLSKLDGGIGTYLALTSEILKGRAVFEHGLATHFIPSDRLDQLRQRLAALENPTNEQVDACLGELSQEPESSSLSTPLQGNVRKAVDYCFSANSVEGILENLKICEQEKDAAVVEWAKNATTALGLRSPTSLKVTLRAIRETHRDYSSSKPDDLLALFQRDMRLATAFCSGATDDFNTGVTSLLVDRIKPEKQRPNWKPSTLSEVTPNLVNNFFADTSSYLEKTPQLALPQGFAAANRTINPMQFSLPSERAILNAVRDLSHQGGVAEQVTSVEELVPHLESKSRWKSGIREKVAEVAARRFGSTDGRDIRHASLII